MADEGWFFLDSVDEVRLRHKSLERALRRFASELGHGLRRAHVFVSCRVSDWQGEEDRAVINRLLQAFKETPASLPVAPDVALLEPIVVTPKDRDSRVGTILLKPC